MADVRSALNVRAVQRQFVALCILFLLACRTSPPPPPTEAAIIDALWRYHTGVVHAATAAEFTIDGDEFARSIQFLEKVTGINSDTANWAGRIPTAELPNTLQRWEAWYAEHRGELRLSADGCGVSRASTERRLP